MRPEISVGSTFPDFELTDHAGKRRTLSELQGNDPMILVLSRGHFCPKDHRQLQNYVAFYPELKVGYTRIVTGTIVDMEKTFREAGLADYAAPIPLEEMIDRRFQQEALKRLGR